MLGINEYGIDFNSNWSFTNGDLVLIADDDNLAQSIINRLRTRLGSLELFYDEYGSRINGFLSWKKTKDTLTFIELEIRDTLKQDVRCQNNIITTDFKENGVIINIQIKYNENEDFTLNLVLKEGYELNILENTNNEVVIDE